MTKRECFLRYLAIIEKLRNSREADFEEINEYLKRKSEITGYELNTSLRTFQRDLKDILSIFDVEIKCNTFGQYYIKSDGYDDMQARMLEAFDLLHAIRMTNDLSSCMFPEKHGGGTENIYGYIHAIKKQLIIKITHQKFWESEPNTRYVEPLGLKEFHGRWYLIANDRNTKTIKTFGLDRLKDFELTREKFSVSQDISMKDIFKNCFGIVIPEKSDIPQRIVLSFTPIKGKYIKSLPLHDSQQVLVDNGKECRIQLFLYITHDFVRELLYHSDELKVISPKSLKDRLKQGRIL